MYMLCHLWIYAAYIYGHPFICNDCSHATCEFTRLIYMDILLFAMIAVMPLVNLRGLHVWTSFFFFAMICSYTLSVCFSLFYICSWNIVIRDKTSGGVFFQMGLGERGQFKKMGGSRGQPDLPWSKRIKIECKEIVLIKSTVHP